MSSGPLISVGIPVYNGARTLRRAIESALTQTEENLELVISDNASTDATEAICTEYANRDPRVRYVRQTTNIGAAPNFKAVLDNAKGELFMWLGDDDWLDPGYVGECAAVLVTDASMALVAGRATYYRNNTQVSRGVVVNVPSRHPERRVASFLRQVADNGTFYGLMRRADVAAIAFPGGLAGDWMLIASLAYRGKIRTLEHVSVHRELGGATESYERLVTLLGLPAWNARFPLAATMANAFRYFLRDAEVLDGLTSGDRARVATLASSAIMYRRVHGFAWRRTVGALRRARAARRR